MIYIRPGNRPIKSPTPADNSFVWKDNQLIVHIVNDLLDASEGDDRERLLTCCRQAMTALRTPMRTTLERELGELLSSIAEELTAVLEAGAAKDSLQSQLSLYHDLLFHVRAMAQLMAR